MFHSGSCARLSGSPNRGERFLRREVRSGCLTAALPLSLILVAGIWPYRFILWLWPTSRDAAVWISRGALSGSEWVDWVFATRHFVGYRPLTALSYSLDDRVGAFSALPYRLTDLALHAACGLLVYLLYRRLAEGLPRWGGLVAAGLFVAHPIAEHVVPHLARRSYSLATFFGLAALLALLPRDTSATMSSPASRVVLRSLPGGLLLVCALLSNETAILTALMLPVFLYWRQPKGADRRRNVLMQCLVPGALVVVALLVRYAAIADAVGGYDKAVDHLGRFLPIAAATWRSLGAVEPDPGGTVGTTTWITLAGFLIVTLYYFACGLVRPIRYRDDRPGLLPALLVLWIVGYVLLFAPMGVWFPRQVYVVLVPFSLLVGGMLATAVRSHTGKPGLLVAHLVPQLLLVALVLGPSPVLHGADPLRVAAFRETDRVLRETHAAIEQLPDPARVQFAVPWFVRPEVYSFRAREGSGAPVRPERHVEIWMRALFRDRPITVDAFLVYERNALDPDMPPVLVMDHGLPALVLPVDLPHRVRSGVPGAGTLPDTITLRVGSAPSPGTGPRHFYFHNGSSGSMHRLAFD